MGVKRGAALTLFTLTNLYSFSGGPDGANPNALVPGANGLFYGTTQNGGTNGYGTIFQLQLAPNGAPTNLYSFTGCRRRRLSGGRTGAGSGWQFLRHGLSGWNRRRLGTIFKITPGGTFSSIYSFTGVADAVFRMRSWRKAPMAISMAHP